MFTRRMRAFTLIEMLVVLTVIGILVGLTIPAVSAVLKKAKLSKSLANLHQVGMALQLYAGDNDYNLPSRVQSGERSGKWSALLYEYLKEPAAYLDPVDASKYKITEDDIIKGSGPNKSSYLVNGFNDLGALNDPEMSVNFLRIKQLSNTILLGKKYVAKGDYYMDVDEGAGNHIEVLDWKTYGDQANFFFADGSAKTLKKADYQPELWLVDKEYGIKK